MVELTFAFNVLLQVGLITAQETRSDPCSMSELGFALSSWLLYIYIYIYVSYGTIEEFDCQMLKAPEAKHALSMNLN